MREGDVTVGAELALDGGIAVGFEDISISIFYHQQLRIYSHLQLPFLLQLFEQASVIARQVFVIIRHENCGLLKIVDTLNEILVV